LDAALQVQSWTRVAVGGVAAADVQALAQRLQGAVRLHGPRLAAAKVTSANPTDCGSQENSAAGLARCLVAMARKYAPKTTVGMHLSCWDWQTNAQGCARDYLNLGAQNADFRVGDVSDRDAGWYAQAAHGGYDNFWTDQKAAAALRFYRTMTDTTGRPAKSLVVELAEPFRLVERENQAAVVGAPGRAIGPRRTGRLNVLRPDLHRPEAEPVLLGSLGLEPYLLARGELPETTHRDR
jgi:hypothetical protein